MPIVTRALAATAYKIDDDRACLTHAVDDETGAVLCKRVKPASILDDPCATDENAPATCPVCAKRDPRTFAAPACDEPTCGREGDGAYAEQRASAEVRAKRPLTPGMFDALKLMCRPSAEGILAIRGRSMIHARIPGKGQSWHEYVNGGVFASLASRGLVEIAGGDHLRGWRYRVTGTGRQVCADMMFAEGMAKQRASGPAVLREMLSGARARD